MGEQYADAKRPEPYGVNARQAKRPVGYQQRREGTENQDDVERHSIAPPKPLRHQKDGEEQDGALREPLEENLERHGGFEKVESRK